MARRPLAAVAAAGLVFVAAACGDTVSTGSARQPDSGVTTSISSQPSPSESPSPTEIVTTTVGATEPFETPSWTEGQELLGECEKITTGHWFGEDGVFDPAADPVLTIPGSIEPFSVLVRVRGAKGIVIEDSTAPEPFSNPICGDLWSWDPSFPGFAAQVAELETPFTIEFEILAGDPDSPSWLWSAPVSWPTDVSFPFEWEVEVDELASHLTREQAIESVDRFLSLLATGDFEGAATHAVRADWLPEDNIPELAEAIEEGLVTAATTPDIQFGEWCEIARCGDEYEIGEVTAVSALGWNVEVLWDADNVVIFGVGSLEGINVVGLPPRG